jgi:NADH:ubiquinone oxidoreductase subunit 5 (subunit L)/multisubunit Na+/H+ antiporter MnhA subunit
MTFLLTTALLTGGFFCLIYTLRFMGALITWPLVSLTVWLLCRHYRRTRPPHLGDAYPDPDQ